MSNDDARDWRSYAVGGNPTYAQVLQRNDNEPRTPVRGHSYVAHFVGHPPIVGTSRLALQCSAKKQRLLLVGIERVSGDPA